VRATHPLLSLETMLRSTAQVEAMALKVVVQTCALRTYS
jgi:hypothetical protein